MLADLLLRSDAPLALTYFEFGRSTLLTMSRVMRCDQIGALHEFRHD